MGSIKMECAGESVPVMLLCGAGDDGEEDDDDILSFLRVAGGALMTLIPKALV
jgi:hypothetical protein